MSGSVRRWDALRGPIDRSQWDGAEGRKVGCVDFILFEWMRGRMDAE
jgi:hypothetical protein